MLGEGLWPLLQPATGVYQRRSGYMLWSSHVVYLCIKSVKWTERRNGSMWKITKMSECSFNLHLCRCSSKTWRQHGCRREPSCRLRGDLQRAEEQRALTFNLYIVTWPRRHRRINIIYKNSTRSFLPASTCIKQTSKTTQTQTQKYPTRSLSPS